MTNSRELHFTVSLTFKERRIAEKFSRQQSEPEKAEQVYQNTLAVLAVDRYCQYLGIETDLEASDSWDYLIQTLSNTADLELKNFGKIECRPVLSKADNVQIPAEVWHDRIGYLVVEIEPILQEARLIGFVENAARENIPLVELKSLDNFLGILDGDKPASILNNWLKGIVESGWETLEAIEEIFWPPETELGFNFRASDRSNVRQIKSAAQVQRIKEFHLEKRGEEMALLVGITPAENQDMNISVELFPKPPKIYLPTEIKLIVLDENNRSVMQAEAGGSENLEFNFTGEPGERFSIKVALGDLSITEPFII